MSSAFPNENSRGVALGLAQVGKLAIFCTSFAFVEGSVLHRLCCCFKLKTLAKRVLKGEFNGKLRIYPKNEFLRRLPNWDFLRSCRVSADDVRRELNQKVARFLSREKIQDLAGVYVYADESYEILQAAKTLDLCAVYELHVTC